MEKAIICFGGTKNFRHIKVDARARDYFFEGEIYTYRPKLGCFGLIDLDDGEIEKLYKFYFNLPADADIAELHHNPVVMFVE